MGNLMVGEGNATNHDKGPMRPLFGQEIHQIQINPPLDEAKKADHRSGQRGDVGRDRQSFVLGLREVIEVDAVGTDVRVRVQCQLHFQERIRSHEDDVSLARQLFVHGSDRLRVDAWESGIIIDAIVDG